MTVVSQGCEAMPPPHHHDRNAPQSLCRRQVEPENHTIDTNVLTYHEEPVCGRTEVSKHKGHRIKQIE